MVERDIGMERGRDSKDKAGGVLKDGGVLNVNAPGVCMELGLCMELHYYIRGMYGITLLYHINDCVLLFCENEFGTASNVTP